MPIFIVETDVSGVPLDPVGRWHGPIEEQIEVDWIAQELDADEEPIIVPEIEFPSCRHHRRPDWCCTGVRPTRPMPRGVRVIIESDAAATGDEPPGVMGVALECWDNDPLGADRNVCRYVTNDGALPRTTWEISTNAAVHTTSRDPLAYNRRDFVLRADARYVASDASHWKLLLGPPDYEGDEPLTEATVSALAIARPSLGVPADKRRSIVVEEPYRNNCLQTDPWVPQFMAPEDTFTTPAKTPIGGITFFELTWEEIDLTDVGGFYFFTMWNADTGFSILYQHQYRTDPAETYLYSFRWLGYLHVGTSPPIVGDTVRVEVDHDDDDLTTVTAYINDVVEWQVSDPTPWGPCRNHLTDQFVQLPDWTRSTARLDWKPRA